MSVVDVRVRVAETDLRLAGRALCWMPPRWFRAWMLAATRLGDGWAWLLTVAALGAEGEAAVLGAAAASMLGVNVLQVLLKGCFRRARPCDEWPHPAFRVRAPDRFSFPSGHAMNAFALFVTLALPWPLLAPPLALFACSVALSRVVLGLHYPSDVVAGSALGAAVGAACHLAI